MWAKSTCFNSHATKYLIYLNVIIILSNFHSRMRTNKSRDVFFSCRSPRINSIQWIIQLKIVLSLCKFRIEYMFGRLKWKFKHSLPFFSFSSVYSRSYVGCSTYTLCYIFHMKWTIMLSKIRRRRRKMLNLFGCWPLYEAYTNSLPRAILHTKHKPNLPTHKQYATCAK